MTNFNDYFKPLIEDLRVKAQEMLDATQVDDRIADGFRAVAEALTKVADKVDDLDKPSPVERTTHDSTTKEDD